MSVVDLFKNVGEFRAKEELGSDYFYNNRSVYTKNFTTKTYKNIVNSFTEVVSDEDILSIRTVDKDTKETYEFNRVMNNRMQRFTFKNKLIDYKEITNIEEMIGEGYFQLKQQGYNHFYNLYKVNSVTNREEVLCVLAIKK